MRTSAVWEWTDVQITALITPFVGGTMKAYVLTFSPIHIPR